MFYQIFPYNIEIFNTIEIKLRSSQLMHSNDFIPTNIMKKIIVSSSLHFSLTPNEHFQIYLQHILQDFSGDFLAIHEGFQLDSS